jgi:SpoVK/Ycf46/Vps4 family AAA+-type ATPase
MRAISWRALHACSQYHRRPACRIVAGVRHSLGRNFHRSAVVYRAPEDPAAAAASENKDDNEKPDELKDQSVPNDEAADNKQSTIHSNDALQRAGRKAAYGSGLRRANRNRRAPEVPPLVLPEWFWEKNVTCWGEPEDVRRRVGVRLISKRVKRHPPTENNALLSLNDEKRPVLNRQAVKELEMEIAMTEDLRKEVSSLLQRLEGMKGKLPGSLQNERAEAPTNLPLEACYSEALWDNMLLSRRDEAPIQKLQQLAQVSDAPPYKDPSYWYSLPDLVYDEIFTSFRAELRLLPPKINIKDVYRPETLLVCPRRGGLRFLDAVVQRVATYLEADVIRLDAEDIAQILGGYLGEDVAWTRSPTAVLGYERTGRLDATNSATPNKKEIVDEEEEEGDAYEGDDAQSAFAAFVLGSAGPQKPFRPAITIMQPPSKSLQEQNFSKGLSLASFLEQAVNPASPPTQPTNPGESWNEYKLGRAMEAVVAAADVKRARSAAGTDKDQQAAQNASFPESKGLIIQISDYKQLNDHPLGYNILRSLREAVKKRWYEGQSIMIVGTTAEEWHNSTDQAKYSIGNTLSPEAAFDSPRTIFVPPGSHESRISDDREAQILDLNLRHVDQMLRKFLGAEKELRWTIDLDRDLFLDKEDKFDIDCTVWNYAFVRRIAMIMLGSETSSRLLDGITLKHAWTMLHLSDERKLKWAKVDDALRVVGKSVGGLMLDEKSQSTAKQDAADKDANIEMLKTKLEKLKTLCSTHEKRFLGGVIDPANIHTTFADVQAPPETIEALKTLTSLSLIRPDSFSYGVLATDKIPGLLLYGPPGTGKTLLAKAVAKESGATMLEVSASEINDMYVGEGEKNVKAVFSLAKKLSPCVVFIDEADSIFGSRGDSERRRSHREVINQFLREWDGMEDLSAFIMVATNRPFDLDEAILRRLPRRLLVDLPLEKDRKAILKIHLKEEILDDSISLATLAKNTPFYSGSDLKNLSVAAALACVREENDIAGKHTGEEPYVYPPKRILRKEHFDKAMEEISASISEDMSTLQAIRKFDERYGDRKGRRKKASALGFGGTTDPEPDSESGRVRKVQLNV